MPIGLGVGDKVYAIAIVHPWDVANRKIGEDIVRGRINRELNHINKRDSYTKRTNDSVILAKAMHDDKLIIPFPDYIISPFCCEAEII